MFSKAKSFSSEALVLDLEHLARHDAVPCRSSSRTGEKRPSKIAVDSKSGYWSNSDDGTIMKVAK